MCNHYWITKNQAAIRDLFKVARYHWRGSSSAR
jgi:hypothetical protein